MNIVVLMEIVLAFSCFPYQLFKQSHHSSLIISITDDKLHGDW